MKEDRSFGKFTAICYVLGFISLLCLGYIYVFGVPGFTNFNEERKFCFDNSGMPIEPSRDNYNTLLCIFSYDKNETTGSGKWMTTVPDKITNKDWADSMGKKVGDYCFHCWDDMSCASPYNDVLREKGVHC